MIHSCSLKQKVGEVFVLVWLFVAGLNCRKQFTGIVNFCWENLGHSRALELDFYHWEKHCPVSRCSASANDQHLKSECQPWDNLMHRKKIILVILNFSKRLWQRVQQKSQTPSSPNIFQQNLKVGSGNKKFNPLILRFSKSKVVRYQCYSLPDIFL